MIILKGEEIETLIIDIRLAKQGYCITNHCMDEKNINDKGTEIYPCPL